MEKYVVVYRDARDERQRGQRLSEEARRLERNEKDAGGKNAAATKKSATIQPVTCGQAEQEMAVVGIFDVVAFCSDWEWSRIWGTEARITL